MLTTKPLKTVGSEVPGVHVAPIEKMGVTGATGTSVAVTLAAEWTIT